VLSQVLKLAHKVAISRNPLSEGNQPQVSERVAFSRWSRLRSSLCVPSGCCCHNINLLSFHSVCCTFSLMAYQCLQLLAAALWLPYTTQSKSDTVWMVLQGMGHNNCFPCWAWERTYIVCPILSQGDKLLALFSQHPRYRIPHMAIRTYSPLPVWGVPSASKDALWTYTGCSPW